MAHAARYDALFTMPIRCVAAADALASYALPPRYAADAADEDY